MTFKPAHKQDNPEFAPGQITTPLPGHCFVDKTLADYLIRKRRQDAFDSVAAEEVSKKSRLTFEEWWKDFSKRYSLDDCDFLFIDFKQCWKAAQENCR